MTRNWAPVEMPAGVPPAAGAYLRAVRASNLLFVSGQVPRDFETGEVIGTDIATQTRATIQNLRHVLEAAGSHGHRRGTPRRPRRDHAIAVLAV